MKNFDFIRQLDTAIATENLLLCSEHFTTGRDLCQEGNFDRGLAYLRAAARLERRAYKLLDISERGPVQESYLAFLRQAPQRQWLPIATL